MSAAVSDAATVAELQAVVDTALAADQTRHAERLAAAVFDETGEHVPARHLALVPQLVTNGDVVDFPAPRRDEDEPNFTRTALQRSAESAVPLLTCAAENYANPHAPLAHKLDVALAGLDASIAVLADYRRSHERPNLRVVGDSPTGGAA